MLENSNQFGFCCSDRGDISVLGNLPGFGQISLDMGRWWGDLVLKTTKTKTGKNLHTSLSICGHNLSQTPSLSEFLLGIILFLLGIMSTRSL